MPNPKQQKMLGKLFMNAVLPHFAAHVAPFCPTQCTTSCKTCAPLYFFLLFHSLIDGKHLCDYFSTRSLQTCTYHFDNVHLSKFDYKVFMNSFGTISFETKFQPTSHVGNDPWCDGLHKGHNPRPQKAHFSSLY